MPTRDADGVGDVAQTRWKRLSPTSKDATTRTKAAVELQETVSLPSELDCGLLLDSLPTETLSFHALKFLRYFPWALGSTLFTVAVFTVPYMNLFPFAKKKTQSAIAVKKDVAMWRHHISLGLSAPCSFLSWAAASQQSLTDDT